SRHDISLSRARARWQLSRVGGSADQKSCDGKVGHRYESPDQVTLVGSSYKSKHRMTEAGGLNRGTERQL
ncbi:MAG: hypothetical protein ABW061_04030, partial [Polyangiaceae bacterium]